MPYYLRLFSQREERLTLAAVRDLLDDTLVLEIEEGNAGDWQALLISTGDGEEICLLERSDEELLREEVEEFHAELAWALPANAAAWVAEYLGAARLLVSCQFLAAASEDAYASVPAEALWAIRNRLGDGILQADHEGFSNREGYLVVWQFSDGVEGDWNMAVMDGRGGWLSFTMDLGNEEHRRAFRAGKIPRGVKVIAP